MRRAAEREAKSKKDQEKDAKNREGSDKAKKTKEEEAKKLAVTEKQKSMLIGFFSAKPKVVEGGADPSTDTKQSSSTSTSPSASGRNSLSSKASASKPKNGRRAGAPVVDVAALANFEQAMSRGMSTTEIQRFNLQRYRLGCQGALPIGCKGKLRKKRNLSVRQR